MTDDELLAELAAAERESQQIPESFLAVGRGALSWLTVDAELAELQSRVDTAEPEGVRDAVPGARLLTFGTSTVSVELELTPRALQGQLVPPQPSRIELQQYDGPDAAVEAADDGWFTISPAPAGMFRLILRTRDDATVVTAWTHP